MTSKYFNKIRNQPEPIITDKDLSKDKKWPILSQTIANAVFDRAAEAAKLAIARGVACAMNTYNGTVPEVMEVSGAKESSN